VFKTRRPLGSLPFAGSSLYSICLFMLPHFKENILTRKRLDVVTFLNRDSRRSAPSKSVVKSCEELRRDETLQSRLVRRAFVSQVRPKLERDGISVNLLSTEVNLNGSIDTQGASFLPDACELGGN
jgi:hypothetical protein